MNTYSLKLKKPLTRGQLAQKLGLNAEAIRYYEREGLMPEPARSEGGHRLYGEESVNQLLFIKKAQALGFSLAEIQELLFLKKNPEADRGDVRYQVQKKLEEIDQKMKNLASIRESLADLLGSCSGSGEAKHCPILLGLETPNQGESS